MIGQIDDVTILSTGRTLEIVREQLGQAAQIYENWSLRHASLFVPRKFQLVYFYLPFIRSATLDNYSFELEFQGISIQPTNSIKILGVTIDLRLTFDDYRRDILSKAEKGLNVLKVLNKSTQGVGVLLVRRAYLATLRPLIIYAYLVQYRPGTLIGRKAISILEKI